MASPQRHRVVLSRARAESFAPLARLLLGKLGYLILLPEEIEEIEGAESLRPALVLLEEEQLEVAVARGEAVPILLLTSRPGAEPDDPRVAGALRRPAATRDLYRAIQELTETTPRRTPRVATHLSASCSRGEREWLAVVRSLSENGCLLHGDESLEAGDHFALVLDLPRGARLEIDAECVYRRDRDAGVLFHDLGDDDRQAIADFVTQTLLN